MRKQLFLSFVFLLLVISPVSADTFSKNGLAGVASGTSTWSTTGTSAFGTDGSAYNWEVCFTNDGSLDSNSVINSAIVEFETNSWGVWSTTTMDAAYTSLPSVRSTSYASYYSKSLSSTISVTPQGTGSGVQWATTDITSLLSSIVTDPGFSSQAQFCIQYRSTNSNYLVLQKSSPSPRIIIDYTASAPTPTPTPEPPTPTPIPPTPTDTPINQAKNSVFSTVLGENNSWASDAVLGFAGIIGIALGVFVTIWIVLKLIYLFRSFTGL